MVPVVERRACPRFMIPGALVRFQGYRLFGRRPGWDEEECRLYDISRGGVRFLSKTSPPLDRKIDLQLILPGDGEPLGLAGVSRWIADYQGDGFRYFIGIQLNPYGKGRRRNPLECLDRIMSLEARFLAAPSSPSPDDPPKGV